MSRFNLKHGTTLLLIVGFLVLSAGVLFWKGLYLEKNQEIEATRSSIEIARSWVLRENVGTLLSLFAEDKGATVGEVERLLALFELQRGGESDFVFIYEECLRLVAGHNQELFVGDAKHGELRTNNPTFRFAVGVLRGYRDMLDVEAAFREDKDCERAKTEMQKVKEDLGRVRSRETGRAGRMTEKTLQQ